MEPIEIFRAIRDSADQLVKAYEDGNEEAITEAFSRFVLLMLALDALT
jgi:formiminotetrahydrofolate cyclodeaminase